jgi:hypothetical protein
MSLAISASGAEAISARRRGAGCAWEGVELRGCNLAARHAQWKLIRFGMWRRGDRQHAGQEEQGRPTRANDGQEEDGQGECAGTKDGITDI